MPLQTRRRRPIRRFVAAGDDEKALPDGAVPLSEFVKGPELLARRLAQIGVVY